MICYWRPRQQPSSRSPKPDVHACTCVLAADVLHGAHFSPQGVEVLLLSAALADVIPVAHVPYTGV